MQGMQKTLHVEPGFTRTPRQGFTLNQEAVLELLKKVDAVLAKPEDELSAKEQLEAIKLKLDIIKSLNTMGYEIPKKKENENH